MEKETKKYLENLRHKVLMLKLPIVDKTKEDYIKDLETIVDYLDLIIKNIKD